MVLYFEKKVDGIQSSRSLVQLKVWQSNRDGSLQQRASILTCGDRSRHRSTLICSEAQPLYEGRVMKGEPDDVSSLARWREFDTASMYFVVSDAGQEILDPHDIKLSVSIRCAPMSRGLTPDSIKKSACGGFIFPWKTELVTDACFSGDIAAHEAEQVKSTR